MRRLTARLRKVARHESNVLVLGESGTGKELVARAIHALGARSQKPLVSVNAAALPEQVLESELFGHERGSFTGAVQRRVGLFEQASGGTLFLDEVGELSPAIQAKLLRVLECGELRRVGGNEVVRVNPRLIAATNRNLDADMRAGRFRPDLFFRLAVVKLRLPPLRDRPEDVEPLASHFLASLADGLGRPRAALSADALRALQDHTFPGNVRELRNCIEHALNFCEDGIVKLEDLPPNIPSGTRCRSDTFQPLHVVERDHIVAALELAGWNKSRAASLLEIDRKTLYAKIRCYGLEPTPSDDEPLPVQMERDAT